MKRTMTRAALLGALTLALTLPVGCGLTERRFAKKYYKELCDRVYDCGFNSPWPSEGDCRKDFVELLDHYSSDCKFRRGEARECLQSFRDLSCDPSKEVEDLHVANCVQAWECPELDPEATAPNAQ